MEPIFIDQSKTPAGESDMTPVVIDKLLGMGEVATTPGGAATAIGQPMPQGGPGVVPPQGSGLRTAGRIGLETAGSFVGGTVGALGAGALTRNPTAIGAGIRFGEALGAGAGSLASELFDPSTAPLTTAAEVAGITLGTGAIASGGTRVLRKLIGKSSEGGEELLKTLQGSGLVPPPGAVLESEFIKNAQSFGSAAFGTSELLKNARQKVTDFTEAEARNYISGFQRYHASANKLFQQVEPTLARSGVNLRVDLADLESVSNIVRQMENQGVAGSMPAALQKVAAAQASGQSGKTAFTFAETQDLITALYNQARALDKAAASGVDMTAMGGENAAKIIRERADRIKANFDGTVDAMAKSGRIPPETMNQLLEARGAWGKWLEGERIQELVLKATKDVSQDGPVGGAKLLNQIDHVLREEAATGAKLLAPTTVANLRRYALALRSLEESGKAGGYVLAGRAGQLVGLSGLVVGSPVAIPALVAPHVISFLFSNPTTANLVIKGLHLDPNSAAAARLGRELVTILGRNGYIGVDRAEGAPSQSAPAPGPTTQQPQPARSAAFIRG